MSKESIREKVLSVSDVMKIYTKVEEETANLLKEILQEETQNVLKWGYLDGHDPFPEIKSEKEKPGIILDVANLNTEKEIPTYCIRTNLVLTNEGKLSEFRFSWMDDDDGDYIYRGLTLKETTEAYNYIKYAPDLIQNIKNFLSKKNKE